MANDLLSPKPELRGAKVALEAVMPRARSPTRRWGGSHALMLVRPGIARPSRWPAWRESCSSSSPGTRDHSAEVAAANAAARARWSVCRRRLQRVGTGEGSGPTRSGQSASPCWRMSFRSSDPRPA